MTHDSTYAAKRKEEIDKLLRVGFIRPVKRATWLSPIVIIPKRTGQIRVCVDYRKLCWHKRSLLPTFYPECEHTLKLGLKYIS